MANAPQGPIPGENFTSDRKNYPWHRPPQHTDLDTAIEDVYKRLMTDEDTSTGILTMIEMGTDISTITDMIVHSGIGAGKWTPDFALLLAGPVAHIIYLMAKGYGLDPKLGWEPKRTVPTIGFFQQMKKINEASVRSALTGIDIDTEMKLAGNQKSGDLKLESNTKNLQGGIGGMNIPTPPPTPTPTPTEGNT